MRLLTTLYVTDHRARVSASHHSLTLIAGDGARSRVPLEALEAVVIIGHAQVTSDALASCAARRIRVTSMQGNGKIRFSLAGGIGGNVHLRLAQYRTADDEARSRDLSRWIVAGKLQNARRVLQRWSWDAQARERRRLNRLDASIAKRVERVATATGGDRIRGFEGEGTRIYFEGLRDHLQAAACPFPFESRNRRPPRDPVNAAMGFAYGLLLSEVSGAIEAVGLDPQVGFLHGIRPGRPSLGLDLLEEFRPSIADRFVAGMFTRRMLADEDFVSTTGGACYLTDEGRKRFMLAYEDFKLTQVTHSLLDRQVPRGALPLIQAILLARHLRGDLPAYPPFVMAG